MNRRFIVDSIPEPGAVVRLSDEESHHVRTVLRGQAGESLRLMDGAGTTADAEILPVASQRRREPVDCRVTERRTHAAPDHRICLYVAPPRSRQMSQLVRQATELGVWAIRPVLVERAASKPPASAVDGWREDARQACKQSGNPWVPLISPPEELTAAVSGSPPAGYLGAVPTSSVASPEVCVGEPGEVALWIGPEGGFTPEEEAAILATPAEPLRVGDWILRVETAVVAAIAALYERWRP